jgi:hypothetical protein
MENTTTYPITMTETFTTGRMAGQSSQGFFYCIEQAKEALAQWAEERDADVYDDGMTACTDDRTLTITIND